MTAYPIVGRVHDLPDHAAWLYFHKLGQQFGPICQTKILSNHFVIISTEKVAKDLLSNRADIYSDRPPFKSIYDSKSEAGGMDHLPLMGIGSGFFQASHVQTETDVGRNMEQAETICHNQTRRVVQVPVPWCPLW